MTLEKIRAIEQVLIVNADLCSLYERRGVSREDMRKIFNLAAKAEGALALLAESLDLPFVRDEADWKKWVATFRPRAEEVLHGR